MSIFDRDLAAWKRSKTAPKKSNIKYRPRTPAPASAGQAKKTQAHKPVPPPPPAPAPPPPPPPPPPAPAPKSYDQMTRAEQRAQQAKWVAEFVANQKKNKAPAAPAPAPRPAPASAGQAKKTQATTPKKSNITYRAPTPAPAAAGQAKTTQAARPPKPRQQTVGYDGNGWSYAQKEEPTPIVDVDVRRGQLQAGYGTPGRPALDPINTDAWKADPVEVLKAYEPTIRTGGGSGGGGGGGGVSLGGGTGGGGGLPSVASPVLRDSTENEAALEMLRAQWRAILGNLASQTQNSAEAEKRLAEVRAQMALRDQWNRLQGLRADLGAAGLAYSPMFMGKGTNLIWDEAASQVAEQQASYANAVANLIAHLQAKRAEATGVLSEAELDNLLGSTRRALSAVGPTMPEFLVKDAD